MSEDDYCYADEFPDALDPHDECDGECAQCGRIESLVGGICDRCALKNTIRNRDQRTVREMLRNYSVRLTLYRRSR